MTEESITFVFVQADARLCPIIFAVIQTPWRDELVWDLHEKKAVIALATPTLAFFPRIDQVEVDQQNLNKFMGWTHRDGNRFTVLIVHRKIAPRGLGGDGSKFL